MFRRTRWYESEGQSLAKLYLGQYREGEGLATGMSDQPAGSEGLFFGAVLEEDGSIGRTDPGAYQRHQKARLGPNGR